MELIQSKDNITIKEVKKLKEKRHRTLNSKFLVEGFRFTKEALKSSFNVSEIFINENSLNKWEEYNIESMLTNSTKVYIVKETIFRQLSDTESPQGVIAVVNKIKVPVVKKEGIFVLADRIQDPGNLGTIIRSAHAAGALGVIVTKGTVDIYNEKTLRSTMGSIFNIPVIEDENLNFTKALKESNYKVIVSSLEDSTDFYMVNLNQNLIIAVGNEGSGISDEVYQIGDIKVKIPMPGGAESLNAAVAASVMLFEAVRQKLTFNIK
ncbi:TrmH family RNA methyltransferase [Candidatus Clostridium stratigraminis]|uniref:TrmH family RNA methyltransferase n=1 Tax=Candidatus Clostridium stratigraminis TaxID=3381661 RepID=A0ABW8T635_9CLOT